jgi:hypothetical protein
MICHRLQVLAVLLAITFTVPLAGSGEGPGPESEAMERFRKLDKMEWQLAFQDPDEGDWRMHWLLDGRNAKVEKAGDGIVFRGGPDFGDNASHGVLWTRQSFDGDIRIRYEYTRLDEAIRAVNILYVQATGSGSGPYKQDIAEWAELREVAAMWQYYRHMHTYHVSYAAFGLDNMDPEDDYVRARRYMPGPGKGLKGTELEPDYARTGLFKPGVPHWITVIKKGNDLYMHVRNKEKEMLFHWKNDAFPAVVEGRIGLRHMYTRGARYRDFTVHVRDTGSPEE